jgi:hypothetical protein
MEILSLLSHPAFWIVIAAIEEIIALSPLKSNSILQLVFKSIHALRPSGKK